MAIDAELARERTTGKRGAARCSLRLKVSSTPVKGTIASALIHNISKTGILLEAATPLKLGEEFSLELPHAGEIRATVVWRDSPFYGCQFSTPLSQAALSAAKLRSFIEQPEPADEPAPAAISEPLSARLRRLRTERGLTQSELRRLTGLSKPSVWAWESGRTRPGRRSVRALAEALSVSEREILTGVRDQELLQEEISDPNGDLAGTETLAHAIAVSKMRIGELAGTTADKVTITIEF